MSDNQKLPTAESRIKKDYMRLKEDPMPYITAEPLPSNILEWHYCFKGPENSPYYGGYYHGKLLFPREFPFKPPSIYMVTPNGRFMTNTRLCLSISDFHPDTWIPTWCVGTILTGLLSFMLEDTPTLGSIVTSNHEKEMFAQKSLAFNLCNTNFCELFPEIVDEITQRMQGTQAAAALGGTAANGVKRSNGLANGATPESADGNLAAGGLANPQNEADAYFLRPRTRSSRLPTLLNGEVKRTASTALSAGGKATVCPPPAKNKKRRKD